MELCGCGIVSFVSFDWFGVVWGCIVVGVVRVVDLAISDADGDLVSVPGHYKLLFTNGNHGSKVAPEAGADASVTTTIQLTDAETVIEPYPAL